MNVDDRIARSAGDDLGAGGGEQAVDVERERSTALTAATNSMSPPRLWRTASKIRPAPAIRRFGRPAMPAATDNVPDGFVGPGTSW